MEAKRYRRLCRLVDQLAPQGRRGRQQFSDAVIAKVFFHATHCDRPVSWACREENWPREPVLRHQAVGQKVETSIAPGWLLSSGVIGLTAGASTPNNKVGETVVRLCQVAGLGEELERALGR